MRLRCRTTRVLTGVQITLLLLAAPAATAGSFCIGKALGALMHRLVTDLSSSEIVLGKLAARLGPVLGLVGSSVPVLFLCTWFGGIDPEAQQRITPIARFFDCHCVGGGESFVWRLLRSRGAAERRYIPLQALASHAGIGPKAAKYQGDVESELRLR